MLVAPVCLDHCDLADEVSAAENFIKYLTNMMDILITNLNEQRARFSEQLRRHDEAIPQVGEIRVDPVLPRVSECLDLFGLRDCIPAILYTSRFRVDTCQFEPNLMP